MVAPVDSCRETRLWKRRPLLVTRNAFVLLRLGPVLKQSAAARARAAAGNVSFGHEIVNLLFTITIDNHRLTVLWGC